MHAFVDFHVDVASNTNASDVCEINLSLLTYILTYSGLRILPMILATHECVVVMFSVMSVCVCMSVTLQRLKALAY